MFAKMEVIGQVTTADSVIIIIIMIIIIIIIIIFNLVFNPGFLYYLG